MVGVATPRPPPRDTRALVQYGDPQSAYGTAGGVAVSSQQAPPPQAVVAAPPPGNQVVSLPAPVPVYESMRRFVAHGTSKFFGVDGDEHNEKVWIERRRRLAIKRFGGVKDDYQFDGITSSYGDPPQVPLYKLIDKELFTCLYFTV